MKSLALFFVGVKQEMGKVRWPSRKEMVKYSSATLTFIVIFALFFIASDALLGIIVRAMG